MSDIFCKIIKGEVKADKVDEDENWLAINDIHPVAPVHVLIIPKKHGSLQDYGEKDEGLIGELILAAGRIARKLELDKTGYRLVINYGQDSQAHIMDHMHIHLLGGKRLGAKIIS